MDLNLDDVALIDAGDDAGQDNAAEGSEPKDYFQEIDGQKFAGRHLLVELWDASNLDDPSLIGDILAQGARQSKATILHSHFHHFTPFSGVSGVLVLAESHISIHTWPEKAYAAVDIFMCGECNPHDALESLKTGFKPGRVEVQEHRRGILP